MECLVITVIEKLEGWYVTLNAPVGPFYSEASAMTLANGMVTSLIKSGHYARITVTRADAAA